MLDIVPGSKNTALLLASYWWGQSRKEREGLREPGRGHPLFFSSGKLALISPPPIVWSQKMRRR